METQIIPASAKPMAQQALQQTVTDQKVVPNITGFSEAKVAASQIARITRRGLEVRTSFRA